MGTDDQIASGLYFFFNPLKQIPLQCVVEISKDEVAAEYHVELLSGHLMADILS